MSFAVSFDGSGFLAARPHAAYQVAQRDFTVEAWVRTAVRGGSGTVIGRKGTEGGAGQGGFLLVVRPDGSVKFATDDGVAFWEVVSAAGSSVNDGHWHHLAAIRHGGTLGICLDGVPMRVDGQGTGCSPLNIDNRRRLTIGSVEQRQEPYRNFAGQIGAVAFWAVGRVPSQVAIDMRTEFRGDERGLAGYWTFAEGDGSDRTPVRNQMEPVTGAVSFAEPGAPIAKDGYAAVLSGGGYLAARPNLAYLIAQGDFTIEAWARTAERGGSGTIMGRKATEGGAGQGGFLLVVRPDGTLKFAADDGRRFNEMVTVPTYVNDSRWHHVAAVRHGSEMIVFVDGHQVPGKQSGPARGPVDVSNDLRLTIGTVDQAQEPYRHFTGALHAVALWRGARSPAQVTYDMGTELRGDEPGLTGYWTFAYQNGEDMSPVANPATINGRVTFERPTGHGRAPRITPPLRRAAPRRPRSAGLFALRRTGPDGVSP